MVYQNEDYKYHCIVEGGFEWFKGYERYNLRMLKYMNVYFMGELYYKLRITGLY